MRSLSMTRVLAVCAAIATLALSLLVPSQASATVIPRQAASKDDITCVARLNELTGGERISQVTEVDCSRNIDASALFCQDPLATLYTDVGYQGYRYTFCGNFGTCDKAGYGFRDMGGFVNNALSSFKVYGGCKYMTIYDLPNFSSEMVVYYGNRDWVGSSYNDRASSFRVSA